MSVRIVELIDTRIGPGLRAASYAAFFLDVSPVNASIGPLSILKKGILGPFEPSREGLGKPAAEQTGRSKDND
jgi:hypothetical protein